MEKQSLAGGALQRTLFGAATALLFVAVAALAMWRLDDADTWWHLAAGRWIFAQRALPTHDVFSFTASEQPWIDLQWIFQLLLYGVYSLGGASGLVLMTAGLALLTFGILYRLVRPLGTGVATLTLSLTLLVIHERFMVRPEVASFVLLAVYLTLLEGYPANGRQIWALVPLQIVWVNVHAVFIVGLVLLGAYAAGRTLTQVIAPRRSDQGLRRLWMVAAVAVLVCLCNPYGLRGALFPFTLLTRFTSQKELYSLIGEFQSPLWGVVPATIALRTYKILIAVSAVALLMRWRAARVDRFFAWGAFLALSAMAQRNVGLFALISVPIVADGLAAVRERLAARRMLPAVARYASPIGAAVLSLALLALTFSVATNRFSWWSGTHREFGLGISSIDFPVGAADFVERAALTGNMFNDLQGGGYLVWRSTPARKVFIDGRLEVYDGKFFARYRDVLGAPAEFNRIADEYDITHVVLYHFWQNRKPLIYQLATDRRWALVYLDQTGVVFVRNTPQNAELIMRSVAAIRQQLAKGPSTDTDGVQRGWLSSLVWPVHGPWGYRKAGDLLQSLNLFAPAIREYESALRLRPEFLDARVELGFARWNAGQHDAARAEWERVLRSDPQSENARDALARTAGGS